MADIADLEYLKWLQTLHRTCGQMVTVGSASRIVGLSRAAIHKAALKGKIRRYQWRKRLASVTLLPLSDVLQWNEGREDWSCGVVRLRELDARRRDPQLTLFR